MPHVIALDPVESPSFYTLPQRQAFYLLAASAVYDGTALLSDFVPTLEVLAPDGRQMFEFGQDLLVKQGGGPFVTFAPNVNTGPSPVPATTAHAQTEIPLLWFGPGYTLSFFGKPPTSSGSDPAVTVSYVTLYVEDVSASSESVPLPRLVPSEGVA